MKKAIEKFLDEMSEEKLVSPKGQKKKANTELFKLIKEELKKGNLEIVMKK